MDESQTILLVGKRLALIGDGGADAAQVSAADLDRAIDEVGRKLKRAGIKAKPAVWTHCDIDLGD